MKKKFVFLALAISCVVFIFASQKHQDHEIAFRGCLFSAIHNCVQNLAGHAEVEEASQSLALLEKNGSVCDKGSDHLRIKYVFLQACIEQTLTDLLQKGMITQLLGIIHTPTPATPLCTLPEPLDLTLLAQTSRCDQAKQMTIRSRAHILRNYLDNGGILYSVYPEGGLAKRSQQQQAVYHDMLIQFSPYLKEWVLKTSEIADDKIGATYFFKNKDNRTYVFSIKAHQANDPQEMSEWCIWLGALTAPCIKQRVSDLFAYFNLHCGPSKSLFIN